MALELALRRIVSEKIERVPLSGSVAAVSCGVVDGTALLDLDYSRTPRRRWTPIVMTGDGGLVEVQATAERTPLSRASLDELLALAASGIERCARRRSRRSRRSPKGPCS